MTMGNSESALRDYDSTWEEENKYENTTEVFPSSMQWSWSTQRNMHAAKDMQNYRHKCRMAQLHDVTDQDAEDLQDEAFPNLWFYQNKIPFEADGMFIEDFHRYWFGDYDKLERVHNYIQWLFPIQEKGMNSSYELSPKAIKLFRRDGEAKKRLLMSYKLILDFYGIELVSDETGQVKRAVNWTERFANLNKNTHNNLRITRILKCMGLLGFHHYQEPLVHFFLVETLVKGTLPQVKQSVLDYFMFAVVDKSKRRELIKFALCYFEPKERFVWCPRQIRIQFLKEVEHAQKETERY